MTEMTQKWYFSMSQNFVIDILVFSFLINLMEKQAYSINPKFDESGDAFCKWVVM
jgi:hypothetical protein